MNGGKAISIIDLIRVALLQAKGILEDPKCAAIVREAYAKLPPDPATAAAVDKFTADVKRASERRTATEPRVHSDAELDELARSWNGGEAA